MGKLYEARRDALVVALETQCSDYLHPHVPQGGIQLPAYFTDKAIAEIGCDGELAKHFLQRGFDSSALSGLYWSGRVRARPGLFLGYAASDEGEIDKGVRALSNLLQRRAS